MNAIKLNDLVCPTCLVQNARGLGEARLLQFAVQVPPGTPSATITQVSLDLDADTVQGEGVKVRCYEHGCELVERSTLLQ